MLGMFRFETSILLLDKELMGSFSQRLRMMGSVLGRKGLFKNLPRHIRVFAMEQLIVPKQVIVNPQFVEVPSG